MEWISVKDGLPEIPGNGYAHITVIATDRKRAFPALYERAVLKKGTFYRWKYVWDKIYDGDDITHWMPLPDPPQ